MSMNEWAKKEVEIVCNENKEECGYYTSCAKSALKAFDMLCQDGHSGMSIMITKSILNNLIDGKPLTPINDIPEVWNDVTSFYDDNNYISEYQCKRMSSLFKRVTKDGVTVYSDVNRIICRDTDSMVTYTSGSVSKIINELYPITMPYSGERIDVYCETFLVDEKNGDFDTKGILYAILPGGEKVEINRYMHEVKGEMVDIPRNMYDKLKRMAENRLKNK